MDESLYRELIVDHGARPRNHGRLDAPTHEAVGDNPLCGDRVTLQLTVDPNGVIRAARIEATGCAISTASASLLTEAIEGLTIGEAQSLFDRVHEMMTTDCAVDEDLGSLAALSVARRYPMRVKCATLSWHALREAIGVESAVDETSGN